MKKQYQAPQATVVGFCQNESIADIDVGGGGASFGGGGEPEFENLDTGYQIHP